MAPKDLRRQIDPEQMLCFSPIRGIKD